MLGRFFKKKIEKSRAKEKPETLEFFSPLRIGLHSTINVTSVDLIGLADVSHPQFNFPIAPLTVVAIGQIKNDDDTIWRIYGVDTDETPYIIQFVESYDPRGGGNDVADMMLFRQTNKYEPLSQTEWNSVPEQLGAEQYELDGLTYDRIWGKEIEGKIDLFVFEETVVERKGKSDVKCHQMLFGRSVENVLLYINDVEFLLVGVEENLSEEQDTIITQVGYSIPATAIKVQ